MELHADCCFTAVAREINLIDAGLPLYETCKLRMAAVTDGGYMSEYSDAITVVTREYPDFLMGKQRREGGREGGGGEGGREGGGEREEKEGGMGREGSGKREGGGEEREGRNGREKRDGMRGGKVREGRRKREGKGEGVKERDGGRRV